jgi:hypothetical protein
MADDAEIAAGANDGSGGRKMEGSIWSFFCCGFCCCGFCCCVDPPLKEEGREGGKSSLLHRGGRSDEGQTLESAEKPDAMAMARKKKEEEGRRRKKEEERRRRTKKKKKMKMKMKKMKTKMKKKKKEEEEVFLIWGNAPKVLVVWI